MLALKFLKSFEAKQTVRAAVTDVERTKQTLQEKGIGVSKVEFRGLEFGNESSYAATFANVEGLFLMRPPAISDTKKLIHSPINKAKAAGVKHVAFLSLQGAERNSVPTVMYCLSKCPFTFSHYGFYIASFSHTVNIHIL